MQLLFQAEEFSDPEDEDESAFLDPPPERPRWGGRLLRHVNIEPLRPVRAPLGLRQQARAPRGGLAGPTTYVEEGWRVVEYNSGHLGSQTRDRSRLEFELEATKPGNYDIPYRVTADGMDMVAGSLQLTVTPPITQQPPVTELEELPELY